MSIYCSIFGFGDEHTPRCKRMKRISKGVYGQDDSKPCTCQSSPIAYQHSGVLPSKKDNRGGVLGIAAIPGHITRRGRPALSDDFTPYWPYLRVSMFEADDSVILTRAQVEKLRNALNQWLKRAAPEGETK
jgi:hypothetical protein